MAEAVQGGPYTFTIMQNKFADTSRSVAPGPRGNQSAPPQNVGVKSQPGPPMMFGNAFEHHGIGPGVQKTSHSAPILPAPSPDQPAVKRRVRYEVQAGHREPAILRRIELRQVIAVPDGVSALRVFAYIRHSPNTTLMKPTAAKMSK